MPQNNASKRLERVENIYFGLDKLRAVFIDLETRATNPDTIRIIVENQRRAERLMADAKALLEEQPTKW